MTDAASSGSTFEVSQGFTVRVPKGGEAYVISCDEWEMLKKRLGKLTGAPWLYQNLGSVLIGAAFATLLQILLGVFSGPALFQHRVTAWAIVAIAGVCGGLCWVFARQHQEIQQVYASDIILHMDSIERRFQVDSQKVIDGETK